MRQTLGTMIVSGLYDSSSIGDRRHYFVLDPPRMNSESSRLEEHLKNERDFRPEPNTVKTLRKASSPHCHSEANLELKEKTNVNPNHALRALASNEEVLATIPRRISRKLNALRGQLASAPSSLQGHLHSACYEALFKSGDLMSCSHGGKLDARALSTRSGIALNTPRCASTTLVQQLESNTGHNTPVYAHSRLAPNWGRPPLGSIRKSRPSTATTAAAAAAEAAVAREKLRSAPATLYSDYDVREFHTPSSGWRQRAPPPGKIHYGSTSKQQGDCAMRIPLTLEEEQRQARLPIKLVTFRKPLSSPYNCKMSSRAKKNKSYRELNYTGVTGRTGVPLDVQFLELKAKNSVKKASEPERPVKNPSSPYLQEAFNIASTLDLLGEELGTQKEWAARLTRSLEQQKQMLRLIKRTKGRRAFTCDNIMCEVSQFGYLGKGRLPKQPG